ncbi:MAG TPA: hypothetical protein DCG57_19285 [Candidatus Riflebacteria bacterium]|jgi:uncharacterized protein (DUF885 family)|nr:hypothetical protein [Candidatus Riflebacteria bacterium]
MFFSIFSGGVLRVTYQAQYSHPGFKNVSDHFYREFISRNPVTASWMGDHQFDGLLPDVGADAVERNISFLRDMQHNFSSLPENELSIDEKIDREAMLQFIDQQLFWESDLNRWQLGRDLAMNIGDAIFLLFVRDFAPISDRVQSIISRLRSVPAFLMAGKTLFQKVPALWGEIYLESARNLPGFIDTIENSIGKKIQPVLHNEFKIVAAEAKRALAEFANWLKHAVLPKAESEWSLGPNGFYALLAVKKLGLNQNEILELGKQVLQNANEKLESLSCLILGIDTGSATGARAEVQKRIRSHAPKTFELSLESFRDALNRSRSFVASSGFASIPENEELDVVETPDFMSHLIPFSAYIGPEKTAGAQKGTYLLTRSSSIDQTRYNFADIVNCAIHEGYPGHHLQLASQNLHPGKMRAFCESIELIEGWASYCQNMIREMGFETSPESMFAHATEEVFNAARLITDVNLQTRTWSFNEAVRFLMEQTKIDRASALAEIKRQTQSPGCQTAGLAGESLLRQIKLELQRQFKSDFTDRAFHDLVLYQGSLPLATARQFYPQLLKAEFKENHRG